MFCLARLIKVWFVWMAMGLVLFEGEWLGLVTGEGFGSAGRQRVSFDWFASGGFAKTGNGRPDVGIEGC